MAMKNGTQPTWTTIRKQLKSWDSEALLSLIKEQGRCAWEAVSDRLDLLVDATKDTGWGYGDHTADAVEELRETFEPTEIG